MKLGQTEENSNEFLGRKDAFHVACVLCHWDEEYAPAPKPGEPVRFTTAAFSKVRVCRKDEAAHGIVDPFLKSLAAEDDMFWVLLMPGLAGAPQHNFDLQIPVEGDMDKSTWDCRGCSD